VSHVTNPVDIDKESSRRSGWFGRLAERIGRRLFSVSDRTAAQYGWEITLIQAGLGRSYRDRRFNDLHSCERCSGYEETDNRSCFMCGGTGRVCDSSSSSGGQER
jgi:DnaJ-class molecular chaperone